MKMMLAMIICMMLMIITLPSTTAYSTQGVWPFAFDITSPSGLVGQIAYAPPNFG
jgi:hypothetical protein